MLIVKNASSVCIFSVLIGWRKLPLPHKGSRFSARLTLFPVTRNYSVFEKGQRWLSQNRANASTLNLGVATAAARKSQSLRRRLLQRMLHRFRFVLTVGYVRACVSTDSCFGADRLC